MADQTEPGNDGATGSANEGKKTATKDSTNPKSEKTPIRMIYDQINSLFGNGTNDIFQMEFPARLLEKGNFEYIGSDTINASQVKPPSVGEAEFRLTNDMYDVSSIVGGPNGSKLSERYREVLFSLLASNSQRMSTSEVSLRDDQEKICRWLEEEVDNFDPPSSDFLDGIPSDLGLRISKPKKYEDRLPEHQKRLRDPSLSKKIPRVDLYQKLLDTYNSEKLRWVQFKNDARPKDFSKQNEVDAYDRLLTTYAPVVDSKLEALWTIIVFPDHRVRKFIGYVDVESASETLQRAKENLRSSVCRSIDDTEDIYPVVMTPSNWAKHLTTNFKPEDLLSNTNRMREQLYTAERNRASLLNRRNTLLAGQQDISKLQTAEENARRDLAQAQLEMTIGYSDTVVKVVQLYFDAVSQKARDPAAAVKLIMPDKVVEVNEALKEKGLNVSPLTEGQFTKLRDMQASCLQKENARATASEAFTRAQLALAQAKSQDGTNLLAQIQNQIDSLTMDIEYYKNVLATSPNPLPSKITPANSKTQLDPAAAENQPKVPKAPDLPAQSDSASVWQEIILTYNHNEDASTSMSSAKVSHDNWETGIWFWSASGKSEASSSETTKKHSAKNTDIKVAFRVMKVDIKRPWMDAGVLTKTKEFFRTGSETKINSGKPSSIKDNLAGSQPSNSEDCLLPSFATSFIVAKDVHIILSTANTFDSSFVSDMQSSSNSGGGFLCFSTSKSSSSSDHREGAVVVSDGKNLSIKIAAPQIIGWINELTPEDQTVANYAPLPADEFKSKVKDSKREAGKGPHTLPTPPESP